MVFVFYFMISKDSVYIPLLVFVVYFIYCFIPGLAVTVRRLHDTGRSGLYYFIGFIPCVGAIILIIFLLEDSQPNTNMYGPSNKIDNDNINPILTQGNYLPPQGNIVVQGNVVPGQGNILVPPGNINNTPQINNAYNQNINAQTICF